MARNLGPLFLIMVVVSLLTGCGNDNPAGVTGGNSSLAWRFVDGNSVYRGLAAGSNIRTAQFETRLYLTYTDGNHIRVAVYNGNDAAPAWASVAGGGGSIEKAPIFGTARMSSLVVFSGKLYAVWTEGYDDLSGTVRPDCVRVAVYNGNDAAPVWHFVDGGGDTTTMPGSQVTHGPSAVVNGTKLYVAYGDSAGGVAVYNGDDASPAWANVDNGSMDGRDPVLMSHNGALYVAFAGAYYGISVKVYNGNDVAPAWTSVVGPLGDRGGSGLISRIPLAQSTVPSLATFGGRLYLMWQENLTLYNWSLAVQTAQFHVVVYNGNDAEPDWSFVDGGGAFGINKDYMAWSWSSSGLSAANGKLYAVWSETYPLTYVSQVRVAVFNGNPASPGWSFVDGNEITGLNKDTTLEATDPFLVAFGGKVYASWGENGQVRIAAGK